MAMFNNMMLAQLMKDLQVGLFWVGIAISGSNEQESDSETTEKVNDQHQQKNDTFPHRDASTVGILKVDGVGI